MRRMLVALLLSLPLALAGQASFSPARAEGTGATPTYVYAYAWPRYAYYGAAVQINVSVLSEQGSPDGPVRISVDGQELGQFPTTPEPGHDTIRRAHVSLPVLDVGDHEVRVYYPGTELLAPSSWTTVTTVGSTWPTMALEASDDTTWVGSDLTLTATMAPDTDAQPGTASPSGTVTFMHGDEVLGTRPVGADGTASLTVNSLPVGELDLKATYSGDTRYWERTVSLAHEVRRVPTTTGLTVSDPQPTYGDALRVVARVRAEVPDRGAPTGGTVEFLVDGTSIATVPALPVEGPSDGVSSLAVLERSDIGAGPHRVAARYRDSAGFESSDAAPVDIVIARRPTAIVASPVFIRVYPFVLPNALLRATVTGGGRAVAGVPLTFTAGKTTLCTATTDASGVATCDATAQRLALTLNGGYVAAFAGDADNLASSARGTLIG